MRSNTMGQRGILFVGNLSVNAGHSALHAILLKRLFMRLHAVYAIVGSVLSKKDVRLRVLMKSIMGLALFLGTYKLSKQHEGTITLTGNSSSSLPAQATLLKSDTMKVLVAE